MNPISDADAARLADAMFALSSPGRLQILGSLADGPLPVGQITAALGMEQSAVSHQLRVLREAGLVIAERRGKHRHYALSSPAVLDLLTDALRLVAPPERATATGT